MRIITVTCPACKENLEIDVDTRTVTRHHSPLAGKGNASMADRLKALAEQKSARESMVAQGKEREKARKERADQLFDRVKETSREGPPEDKPLRDFDLE